METTPPRILIADDSRSARIGLRDQLCEHCRCEYAENGKEALEQIEKAIQENDPYRVVFMDIMMPVLNGLEAAKRVKSLQESYELPESNWCKVVVISNLNEPEYKMKAHFESGVQVFLPKPVTRETLNEVLRNLGCLENFPGATDPVEEPDTLNNA